MIVVSCQCGKRFKVPDELAGRAGRCTNCGWRVVVPLAQGTPEAEARIAEVFSASAEQLNALIDRDSGEPKAVVAPEPLPRAEALVGREIGGLVVGRRLGYRQSSVFEAAGADQKVVAVKILPREKIDRNPVAAKRLHREARALIGVSHPNLVTIHDVGEELGSYYLTMEHHPGMNLEQKLEREGGKLSEEYVLSIVTAVARGLDHLHGRGLVHRAVRPKHILIEPPVKLCGFGLVRTTATDTFEDIPGATADVTTRGQIIGKPDYMSPEQVSGKELDGRSDLFSLGVTAYRVLTGELPFTGVTPIRIVREILQKQPPPVNELVPEISEPTARIVERLLEKDPKKRYATARDLLKDLGAPVGGRVRGEGGGRLSPALVFALVAVLVAVGLVVGFLAFGR